MLFKLLLGILKFIFNYCFRSKKYLTSQVFLLTKQNEILLRSLKDKKIKPNINFFDKFILTLFLKINTRLKKCFSIIKPATILKWYQKLSKERWHLPHNNKKTGRPPLPTQIKELVLKLKNENIYMRTGKIQGELQKLRSFSFFKFD